ncbi:DUF6302 family protein [Streptomyces goshikiensis]|uniref:Uncharacterized protein n=2 Tax=Streptomyces TaxID=1883 RepID=A0A5D4JJH1_9ACTN|nr:MULTISPECIES: DUF6302 family protein [Streptomyces]TYR65657.1 hypothetical protein FY004_04790 [Streptomyces parvus]WRK36783.1 DUF6302 family protein [Streptomyces venezuelae]
MLTTTKASTRSFGPSLCPAEEAYDFEHFRNRLARPEVLAHAVAVRVFRAPLLAVPVGGPRRGGYMSFDLLSLAIGARDLLTNRPGFPDLRVRWSPYRDTCHTVEWGDPAPGWWEDDAVFGRFYGYSESAITSFVGARPQTPSSATSTPCSPTAS